MAPSDASGPDQRSGDARQAQLERISRYEAGIRPTLVNRILQRIGPTRPFIAVYRRVGPKVDPWLVRRTGGGINRLYGFPALLLTTIGARSGEPRTSPLFYVRDGDDFAIVGTNFGTAPHPAWTANLLKHPEATIVVGEEHVAVTAELADQAVFDRLWPKFRAVYGGYDKYLERLTNRTPRLFLLHPVAPAPPDP